MHCFANPRKVGRPLKQKSVESLKILADAPRLSKGRQTEKSIAQTAVETVIFYKNKGLEVQPIPTATGTKPVLFDSVPGDVIQGLLLSNLDNSSQVKWFEGLVNPADLKVVLDALTKKEGSVLPPTKAQQEPSSPVLPAKEELNIKDLLLSNSAGQSGGNESATSPPGEKEGAGENESDVLKSGKGFGSKSPSPSCMGVPENPKQRKSKSRKPRGGPMSLRPYMFEFIKKNVHFAKPNEINYGAFKGTRSFIQAGTPVSELRYEFKKFLKKNYNKEFPESLLVQALWSAPATLIHIANEDYKFEVHKFRPRSFPETELFDLSARPNVLVGVYYKNYTHPFDLQAAKSNSAGEGSSN